MHRISDRTMSHSPEAIVEGKKRPFTGAEFVESLRDGREVYIYGERVADVTKHPAFRNSVASVALLYDALHDPKTKDVLTAPTDTGSGGYTHKFFKVARSAQDVIAQRDAIAAWARITYGWMGRSPDYKAAFLNTLGANAEFYGKFADNARAWHRRAQEAVLYLNHALVNPPIDRNKPVEQVRTSHHHPERDRRRHLRLGRQGGGHQLGPHPLQLPGPEHGPEIPTEHGGDVHCADGHARHQAHLPAVLRVRSRRHRLALGLSAHVAFR
jgi:4-hydroxyphenylacetate 3-monooxygenase